MARANRKRENEPRAPRQQSSDGKSASAKAAAALIDLTQPAVQPVLTVVRLVVRAVQAAAKSSAQAASAAAPAATATVNALGAAYANVQALIGALAAATAHAAPVIQAVQAAMAVLGPFSILAVASVFGLTNAERITEAAKALTAERALALADAISYATTQLRSEKAVLAAPHAAADLIATRLGLPSAEAGQHMLAKFIDGAGAQHAHDKAFQLRPVTTTELDENDQTVVVIRADDPRDGVIEKRIVIGPYDYEAGAERSVSGAITNSAGMSIPFTVPVIVRDVNEAPHKPTVTSVFDGRTLTITVHGTDPDAGDVLAVPGPFVYTVEQLAAGVAPFEIVIRDRSGLESSPVLIEPPKIAAAIAAEYPMPPAILGIDTASVRENRAVEITVTAYDAIDGVLTRTYTIPPQDYERVRSVDLDVVITNSSGLSDNRHFDIAISNVLETRTIILQDYDLNGHTSAITSVGRLIIDGDVTSARKISGPSETHEVLRFGFADLGYIPTVSISGSGRVDRVGRDFVDVSYFGSDGDVQHHNSIITLHEVPH